MARLKCSSCGKINVSTRTRCMYCEADLAGAAAAPDDVPDYLRNQRHPFPWFKILGLAGSLVLVYFYFFVWTQKSTVVIDVPFTANPHTIPFTLDQDAMVEIRIQWASGTGSVALQKSNQTVASRLGSSPLVLSEKLTSGAYEVWIQDCKPPGTVQVLRK